MYIPYLCDLLLDEEFYFWFRLEVTEEQELHLVRCAVTHLGETDPYWLFEFNEPDEHCRILWGCLIDDHRYDVSDMDWALRNGLAPGQICVIRIFGIWSSEDYYGEWDTGHRWQIVWRQPCNAEQIWCEYFDKHVKSCEAAKHARRTAICKVHHDHSALHLEVTRDSMILRSDHGNMALAVAPRTPERSIDQDRKAMWALSDATGICWQLIQELPMTTRL